MISKYFIHYIRIIENAQKRTSSGYIEIHHIIPKSMGGSNKKENLVALTAREHFICHLLLTKITDGVDKRKMSTAFMLMCPKEKRNSRAYKIAREIHATFISKTFKGKPKTIEHKEKISKGLIGIKRTEETKEILRHIQKERMKNPDYINPFSGEQGSLMSSQKNIERVLNGTNPWAGEKGSEQSKKVCKEQLEKGIHPFQGEHGKALAVRRNKESIKNGTHINCKIFTCPHCNLTGKGPNMLRWHFEKCKNKSDNFIDI